MLHDIMGTVKDTNHDRYTTDNETAAAGASPWPGAGGGKLEAIKMLDYLSDYTEFHFGAEEKLQEEANYPGLEEHKKQHAAFVKAVGELHEMLEEEEGPTDAFVEAVNKNVIDWLYKHIKGFDCSVASYINMNGHAEML